MRNEGVSERKSSILVQFKGMDEMIRKEDGKSVAAEIKRVLVSGAGTADLAAGVELACEVHDPVFYKKSSEVDGVWNYTLEADSDTLSIDHQRKQVHSNLADPIASPRCDLCTILLLVFSYRV